MDFKNIFSGLTAGRPEDIRRLKLHGDFAGAIRLIDKRLAGELPEAMRRCLTVQREIMRRLPDDFPYTRDEALSLVREHIPDFTEEEFEELVDIGQIRWIYVNGEPRYFDRFYSSICKSLPEIARRADASLPGAESAGTGSQEVNRLDRCIQQIKVN